MISVARAAAALAAVVFGVLGTVEPVTPSAAATGTAGGVTMRVVDMSPSAPARSKTSRPLTVTLALTNTTGTAINGVSITGRRGNPVTSQSTLDDLVDDASPTPDGIEIEPTRPVNLKLPGDGVEHTVTFRTTYGVPTGSGICQCAEAGVYPLYFSAIRTTPSGTDVSLDTTVTFLPSFLNEPDPVRVAWVWPLLDRPHRLSSSTVFLDDALATEVAEGGRLDRALATVEQVADSVPVTLVVDPDLLDELSVMSTGRYTVRASTSSAPVAGTGQAAAAAWLARFTDLLDTRPAVRVALTPFADPDIPSLSLSGLSWRTKLPSDMSARVARALGTRTADYSLAWPASGAYTATSLDSVVRAGVTSALLPSTAVTPRDGDDGPVAGLARLRRNGTTVGVGLLSPAVQLDVAAAVARTTTTADRLPQLLGEIAVRAAGQPDDRHTLVLAAPRYVDADPDRAAAVIRASSDSPFARRISLRAALDTDRLPDDTSELARFASSTRTLSAQIISAATDVHSLVPAVSSMLDVRGQTATNLAGRFPVALQRVSSSYWLAHPDTGTALAQRLRAQIGVLTGGRYVYVVPPFSGSYTLASSNAPLPVTIRNKLSYPVGVRVLVRTVNGQPGFTVSKDLGTVTLAPTSRSTLRLPASIERSGRIQIEVQLLAPQGHTIGESVPLTVHSTAFGVVGVVITIVAGLVLALALLFRLGRQLLRRRRSRAGRPRGSERPVASEPAA